MKTSKFLVFGEDSLAKAAALSEKADEVIERHDQLLLRSEDYNFLLEAFEDKHSSKAI